jgi:hypothetical protein
MANEQVARSVLCNGGPDVALAALQLNLDDGDQWCGAIMMASTHSRLFRSAKYRLEIGGASNYPIAVVRFNVRRPSVDEDFTISCQFDCIACAT